MKAVSHVLAKVLKLAVINSKEFGPWISKLHLARVIVPQKCNDTTYLRPLLTSEVHKEMI